MKGGCLSIGSKLFPFGSGFVRISSVEFCQKFRCIQVESFNPLVLISSGRPFKPFNVILEWATPIMSVDFGVENSCKFKMFFFIDDFNWTGWNFFLAGKWIREMR
jgi:hypothetical protein